MPDTALPPRSVPTRDLITIGVTPHELHRFVRLLEKEAVKAADEADQIAFADFLFQRIAALREAGR
jgi:hypothetical protein